MIKINHKASILIEIIVIKNTHKHWQPFLHLHTSANTRNALIQWVYPTRQSCISELLNQFVCKISCRTRTFNNLIKQGTYKSNTFNKRKQQQEQTFVWDLWAWKFKRKKNMDLWSQIQFHFRIDLLPICLETSFFCLFILSTGDFTSVMGP